jgi:hypothetical protein
MLTPVSLGRPPAHARRARSDVLGGVSVASHAPRDRRGIQLGPRVRIGGTIGKIGQQVKVAAGKIASNPFVEGIAGATLGPGAAAAVGALGKALDTSHGSVGAGSIAGGGLQGYGAGKLGGIVKNGLNSVIGGAPTDGASGSTSIIDRLKGLVTGGGADGTGNFGLAGDIGGKLLGGGGGAGGPGGSFLDKALLAGSIASNAADRERQQGVQNRAIDYTTGSYDARAPLRARALASLSTDQAAPDLSSIFENPGNAYDRARRGMPPLATRTPAAAAQTGGQALSGALSQRAKATPPTMTPVAY